jgi:hypothetical protein
MSNERNEPAGILTKLSSVTTNLYYVSLNIQNENIYLFLVSLAKQWIQQTPCKCR